MVNLLLILTFGCGCMDSDVSKAALRDMYYQYQDHLIINTKKKKKILSYRLLLNKQKTVFVPNYKKLHGLLLENENSFDLKVKIFVNKNSTSDVVNLAKMTTRTVKKNDLKGKIMAVYKHQIKHVDDGTSFRSIDDPILAYNIFGHMGCRAQAKLFESILSQMGVKTRSILFSKKEGNKIKIIHRALEANIDNNWSFIDPAYGFLPINKNRIVSFLEVRNNIAWYLEKHSLRKYWPRVRIHNNIILTTPPPQQS